MRLHSERRSWKVDSGQNHWRFIEHAQFWGNRFDKLKIAKMPRHGSFKPDGPDGPDRPISIDDVLRALQWAFQVLRYLAWSQLNISYLLVSLEYKECLPSLCKYNSTPDSSNQRFQPMAKKGSNAHFWNFKTKYSQTTTRAQNWRPLHI